MTELNALLARAKLRRADGQPCNPRRDPVADEDWLSHDELSELQSLMFEAEVERLRGKVA